jgi:Peptidase family M1 domain
MLQTQVMRILLASVTTLIACTLAPLASAQAPAPKTNNEPVYRALRDAGLADAVLVENLVLHRDNGTITFKSGTLAFTPPQMGRDTIAIFVGEGEFTFNPVHPVDLNYMRSVSGQSSLTETFDHALFCFSDTTGKEIRDQSKSHAADPKAAEYLNDYRHRLRSRLESPRSLLESLVTGDAMDNVEADLLTDLYNPKQPGAFNAYLHGKKHSDLRFFVRPRGAFPELGTPEEVALINYDPEAQQEGIWYLSHTVAELQNHTASSDENKRSVESQSYKISTTITKADHLVATTEIHLRAVTEGDRVIKLALLPNLRVTRASADGQEIPFIQEDRKLDGSLYAVLPAAMAKGSEHTLALEYAGDKVIHKAGAGNYSVGAREDWYPNVNTFRDHAQYDLTFQVPKQFGLVSVGKLEKSSVEKDQSATHWVSDFPIAVAGFNFGDFKVKKITDPQSGFTIEGYANSQLPDSLKAAEMAGISGLSPVSMMDTGMSEAQNSIRLFSAWFGKSEFGRIAITQQPEANFGQSWPALVYLPLFSFLDATNRWQIMGQISPRLQAFVDEVTPHEVSHQWWGHMVGWSTYHDQWLSEGFATFSAGLYLQATEKTPDKYQKYWETARKDLLDKNNFGQRANDAGPVWLGLRLSSFKNDEGYQEVVYRKGAYVLHMLRQLMWDSTNGDKNFMAMMQDFVKQYKGKNASTEDFQRVVEQHMTAAMDIAGDHKMTWFFSEWVYGITVPKYKIESTVTPAADGKFQLKAQVTQSDVSTNFAMQVPIYLDFGTQVVRLGSAKLIGNTSVDVDVMLPKQPKRVLINYWHDVLEQ